MIDWIFIYKVNDKNYFDFLYINNIFKLYILFFYFINKKIYLFLLMNYIYILILSVLPCVLCVTTVDDRIVKIKNVTIEYINYT